MSGTTDDRTRGDEGAIDFRALFLSVKQHRVLVAATPLVFFLLAVGYLHVATYKYTVELMVTPVQDSAQSANGQLGGLMNLAGLPFSLDSTGSEFLLYIKGIKSRVAADVLVERQEILRQIFEDEWSEEEKKWVNSNRWVQFVESGLKSLFGAPFFDWKPPDAGRLHEYLEKRISVSNDLDDGYITIAMDHKDPEVAKSILTAVHLAIDGELRRQALERTGAYIVYLTKKLEIVRVEEYRRALVEAIANQEKTRMMASSDVSYVAKTFGGPVASVEPTTPSPVFFIILSIVGGAFFGIVIAILKDRFGVLSARRST